MKRDREPGGDLTVEELVVGHAAGLPGALLHGLSFSIGHPGVLAIVGHNGSGKTTLLRTLTGQLRPLAGQVLLHGRPLPADPAALGLLAWLPQRTEVRFPVEVRALVLMGRFRHKRWFESWAAPDYACADEALASCGVAHLARREFTTLSGGEQQLVWLAQLRAQDAPLCLLDEPTQQLDVYHRRRVFDLLTQWVVQERRTVVCVTHDLTNLAALPPECPATLLNLSAADQGPLCAVPLTAATVAAALASLERGPGNRLVTAFPQ